MGEGLTPSGRLTTNELAAVASVCVRATLPFACVGAGTGLFASRTEGLARAASDSALLAVAIAKLGADVAITRTLFLEPFVDIGVNLARHRVEVDGREVYRMPLLRGAGGLLFSVSFL